MGNGMSHIGNYAFQYCRGLTSITIGNGVTSIGIHSFHDTPWYNNQPEGLIYIGKVAYEYKGTMPEGKKIVIEEGSLGIAALAFSGCSGLKSILIPNDVSVIGQSAFSGCSGLESITIPNNVSIIGEGAFSGCSGLESITIPNNVSNIGKYTFKDCIGLTTIVFGSGITYISYDAFYRCTSVTDVFCFAEQVPESYEYNISKASATLHVPANAVEAYRTTPPWSNFGTIVAIDGILATGISLDHTSVSFNAVNQTATLTATITPANATNKNVTWTSSNTSVATISETGVVTSKGNGTAVITATTIDGTNLSATCIVTVTIDEDYFITFADANVKAICVANWDINGDGELSKDEASVVTSIGDYFKNNASIFSFNEFQHFTSVTKLEDGTFQNCSSLISITIPRSVISIGNYSFSGCTSLKTVIIEGKQKNSNNELTTIRNTK